MVNSQVENFSFVRKLPRDLKTRTNVSCARSFASSSLPTMRQRKWNTGVAWRSIKSLSTVSCPAIRRSISAQSRALLSVCSMCVAGVVRHGLLDLLVGTERELFHFGKITPAFLRRHGLADSNAVFNHL